MRAAPSRSGASATAAQPATQTGGSRRVLADRPCVEPGCPYPTQGTRCSHHQRERNRARNGEARRQQLYTTEWDRHSAERRAQERVCQACGQPFEKGKGRLSATVDHPTDLVLHRSCHDRLEAQRRREREEAGRGA